MGKTFTMVSSAVLEYKKHNTCTEYSMWFDTILLRSSVDSRTYSENSEVLKIDDLLLGVRSTS
jgi:hypothetical protein